MVYVLTDQGWIDYDEIFTPNTGKIKKNAVANPVKENEELTKKLKKELPMVIIRRGYYYIQTV